MSAETELTMDSGDVETAPRVTIGLRGVPADAALEAGVPLVLHRSPVPLFLVRSFEWAPPPTQPLPVGWFVIPVDEEVESLGVLTPAACEVARLFGAKVLLLHVAPSGKPSGEARLRLDEAAVALAAEGIPFDLLVRRGDPAGEFLATCDGHADDLIAMSTHGRRGLPRLRHRNFSEDVLNRTTSPMLVSRVA